eukprot:15771_1
MACRICGRFMCSHDIRSSASSTTATTTTAKVCYYYNTPKGCKKGDACDYKHPKKQPSTNEKQKVCTFYNTAKGCNKGIHCPFQHPKNSQQEQKEAPNKPNNAMIPQMDKMEELKTLHTIWFTHQDVNVKNLGVYLKAVVDGYEANLNKELKSGYVKYGTYSRTFCEVICNYILKAQSKEMRTLKSKMDAIKAK